MNATANRKSLSHIQAIGLIFFTLIVLFNQLQKYSFSFTLVVVLLLGLSFLKEQNRFFVWSILAYFIGDLLYMYSVRIADLLIGSTEIIVVLTQILSIVLMIPIYIVYLSFSKKSELSNLIHREAVDNRKVKFTRIGIVVLICTALIFMVNYQRVVFPIQMSHLGYIIAFAAIHAVLQELLWRKLLLRSFSAVMNDRFAIIATSVGFGITHLALGFTLIDCILFSFLGSGLAVLSLRNKHLHSILLYFTVILLFSLSNLLFLGV